MHSRLGLLLGRPQPASCSRSVVCLLRPLPCRAAAVASRCRQQQQGYASASASGGTTSVLFKLSGNDQLGVVSNFSRVLAEEGAQVLDVDQSACTVHSSFTLNILARIGTSGRAISSMTARAQELQVNLEVVAVPPTALRADGSQGLRYKLTLLKPGMGFDVLSLVADAAARSGLSIEELKRITPMTLAAEGSDGSPSVGLQMILEEGGTASGAVTERGLKPLVAKSEADVGVFVKELEAVQSELNCTLLLQEEHEAQRKDSAQLRTEMAAHGSTEFGTLLML